ncbi:MAG: hypothetical protein ABSB35_34710 [Bryobacteraceae bacterium]
MRLGKATLDNDTARNTASNFDPIDPSVHEGIEASHQSAYFLSQYKIGKIRLLSFALVDVELHIEQYSRFRVKDRVSVPDYDTKDLTEIHRLT